MSSPTPKKLTAEQPTLRKNNGQIEGLKEYVDSRVMEVAGLVSQRVSQVLLGTVASLQTRQLATERLLQKLVPGFDLQALAYEITEVEDEATGLQSVDGAAQEGDTVRLRVWSPDQEGEPEHVRIDSLCKEVAGQVQTTLPELERGIVGRCATTEGSITVTNEEDDDSEPLTLRFHIVKISRKKEST